MAMDSDRLNRWAEQLLDTGKSNRLISYKETASGTAEAVAPAFSVLAKKLESGATLEAYDPKTGPDTEEEGTESAEDGGSAEGVPGGKKKKLGKEEFVQRYGGRLRASQVLLYNAQNTPLAALRGIQRKARAATEEVGVNIAYIAVGFLRWTEKETAKHSLLAPLILIPVQIENESSLEPFRIRVLEDDAVANPTLAYKLKNDFGIALPEYADDICGYMDAAEELFSRMRWEVVREIRVDTFSFLKLNMYEDLRENADRIAQNAAISALLGNAASPGGDGGQGAGKSESERLMELHHVVNADSSQSEAVALAKEGRSFVLQGPPGTGKSQTITNIIAELLHDGKSVLFVSEKLAALNVVYGKLKDVGLGEFCLELHSHKANRREVIAELCRSLELPDHALSERAQKELDAWASSQKKLDGYAEELHRRREPVGMSLYQLYCRHSALRGVPDVEYADLDISAKGAPELEAAEALIRSYEASFARVGGDAQRSAWNGLRTFPADYAGELRLKEDLRGTLALCGGLQAFGGAGGRAFRPDTGSIGRAYSCSRLLTFLGESAYVTPALLRSSLPESAAYAGRLGAAARQIRAEREALLAEYTEDILALDCAGLSRRLEREFSGFFPRLFSSAYREIAKSVRLCRRDGKGVNYAEAKRVLGLCAALQRDTESFAAEAGGACELFGEKFAGTDTDFGLLARETEYLRGAQAEGADFCGLETLGAEGFEAAKGAMRETGGAIAELFAAYGESAGRLADSFDRSCFDVKDSPLESVHARVSAMLERFDSLAAWQSFCGAREKLREAGLQDFLECAGKADVPAGTLAEAYEKNYVTQWIRAVWRESPVLSETDRGAHDAQREEFAEKDRSTLSINRAKIRAILSERRPDAAMTVPGSAMSVLQREGQKKRRQKSVRALLSETGDLVRLIKPCFLMSPLSVSTFLPSDFTFDAVVFDEASQIFPQDAVGAIYRGRQLIVVGDSKQMPPTSFFSSVTDGGEEDDDGEDIADFESILDLCSAVFPQRRLLWHYRSKYEELISFSNKNFYGGTLITFPSVSSVSAEGAGVDYYHVDGVFDRRTKTNRAEAEAVVDLVFEDMERYPGRSVGVVAFSVAQQDLIDRLILMRRREDPSHEEYFSSAREEPFFVKNLETVQGDERDIIIFSVAYGRDADGRLLLNFGPLNRAGGERRLNVAVTRAKYCVQLVSSMHHTDIDISRAKSVGASLLREYLDYAENGEIALRRTLSVSGTDSFDSGFEEEVCEFLRSNGFEVDTQVGCSSFRIDMAVRRPDSSDYVLAVECDGASYHSSKTARDRDRLRQEILESRGWTFYRVWSTDWFRNGREERERLLGAVREALSAAPGKARGANGEKKEAPEGFGGRDRLPEEVRFPEYVRLDEMETACRCGSRVLPTVRALMESEAPVSEEWLLRRIVFLFCRKRVTSVVTASFDVAMQGCERQGIERRGGFLYLKGREIPMLRVPAEGEEPREIKNICPEELANGLRALLKQNMSVGREELFLALAQKLGFSRVSDSAAGRLGEALSLLSDEIETDGVTVTLKRKR